MCAALETLQAQNSRFLPLRAWLFDAPPHTLTIPPQSMDRRPHSLSPIHILVSSTVLKNMYGSNLSHLEVSKLLVGERLDGAGVNGAGHVLLGHSYGILCDHCLPRRSVSRHKHTLRSLEGQKWYKRRCATRLECRRVNKSEYIVNHGIGTEHTCL